MVQKLASLSYTINPVLRSLLLPLLVFFSVLIVLMQIQKCVLTLSITYLKSRILYTTVVFLLSLNTLFWDLSFFAPKGVFPPWEECLESSLGTRRSLTLRAGLAWAGTRPFCFISFVTLGTSPLLPHLHYLIKWGHCEIKWDLINRASLSTSLNRWWFSSLSSVLFYCFILYNIMGLTIQSSAVGEDPSCQCH